jgi:glyoxylase-like metal-dependent hydrolase (beta-lactamase superfamily II)
MKMLKIIRIAAALTALITGCVSVSHSDNHADTTREIAPGVYSFAPGKGYHSMFVVTDDGVAAFETVNSEHATAMLEAIRTITDQPVKYALHSHNHWDYANGGGVMQQADAQTVMHTLAAKWLA